MKYIHMDVCYDCYIYQRQLNRVQISGYSNGYGQVSTSSCDEVYGTSLQQHPQQQSQPQLQPSIRKRPYLKRNQKELEGHNSVLCILNSIQFTFLLHLHISTELCNAILDKKKNQQAGKRAEPSHQKVRLQLLAACLYLTNNTNLMYNTKTKQTNRLTDKMTMPKIILESALTITGKLSLARPT